MVIDNKKLYYGILVLIFGPLFVRFFTENFHMSYAVMPFFDVLCCILVLVAMIINHRKIKLNFIFLLVILSLFFQVISLFLNGHYSIYGISLSIRSFYRLTFALFLGDLVLNQIELRKIMKYIEWLLIINSIIMTYQYFVMGISQDIIGGTFGDTQGVNEIQNVLCCCVFIYEVLKFLNKKSSVGRIAFYTLLTVYICALAELTAFLVELVIIIILAYLFNNNNISLFKKFSFIFIGLLALFGGIRLYLIAFPDRAFLLSFNNALNYLGNNVSSGNTGVYSISRIHPFLQLSNQFFDNNQMKWLGFGLGNCASNSNFYFQYFPLLHYDWLSSSMTFLENGYVGVIFFIAEISYVFVRASFLKRMLDKYSDDIVWLDYARILSIICLILFFYNNSLRGIYTSFLIGFMLCIVFVIARNINLIKVKENDS